MKPAHRQGAVVTTTVHEVIPTPMLDAVLEYHSTPLLHDAIEEHERQSVELEFTEEVLVKPVRKYHYAYGPCRCGLPGDVCHNGSKRRRVYDA